MRLLSDRHASAKGFEAFAKRYFQLEVLGGEHLDDLADKPCLFVMNHRAVIGLEVYLFGSWLHARYPSQHLTTLAWKGFVEGPLGPHFRALGCRSASVHKGVQELQKGHSVLILPEGVGATDPRHRFNPFHSGFLRILREYPVTMVPVGFYGVDEANPWWVTQQPWLVKKMREVDSSFDFALVPKLPMLRPVKVVFQVGKPLQYTSENLAGEAQIKKETQVMRNTIEVLVQQAEDYRRQRIEASLLNRLYHRVVAGKVRVI